MLNSVYVYNRGGGVPHRTGIYVPTERFGTTWARYVRSTRKKISQILVIAVVAYFRPAARIRPYAPLFIAVVPHMPGATSRLLIRQFIAVFWRGVIGVRQITRIIVIIIARLRRGVVFYHKT